MKPAEGKEQNRNEEAGRSRKDSPAGGRIESNLRHSTWCLLVELIWELSIVIQEYCGTHKTHIELSAGFHPKSYTWC